MQIPFSRPWIDRSVVDEMTDCLTNTGWLTSGPKVLAFESEIKNLTGSQAVICVNSWTSGAMLILRWFGVGPGDEVIVPAYTYAATALCAIQLGATVKMVDVRDDFNLDPTKLFDAITPSTKVIIPVDIGGWPADYNSIRAVLESVEIRNRFQANSPEQEMLGRILILADAAHSIGATYHGQPSGVLADATVFSFHSVKNITTGEGGAVCLQLPHPFNPDMIYPRLKQLSLNGQTKSAYEKNQPGAWRYDIVEAGFKCNMPDLCAAVGLAQIRQYQGVLLPDRKHMFNCYAQQLQDQERMIIPNHSDDQGTQSSCHLFMLRIHGIKENQRDQLIQALAIQGIGANVHYLPLPMLSYFKRRGYRMEDYPNAMALYQNEITLPLYNGLTNNQLQFVCKVLTERIKIA